MPRVPRSSFALKTLGLIVLALPLGQAGCAREGLRDYGTASRTVFANQILDPGPPSPVPPQGLSGPMAVKAVEKYHSGEDCRKTKTDSVFLIGTAPGSGLVDKSHK